jgi:hypothetical protein
MPRRNSKSHIYKQHYFLLFVAGLASNFAKIDNIYLSLEIQFGNKKYAEFVDH